MTFYNKIKWILGILLVFVLIITTNLIDRNNFVQVRDSVISIYEDRLVANHLIFEMSKNIQKKEIAVLQDDTLFFFQENKILSTELEKYISKFEQTKLTTDEAKIFETLKNNLITLSDQVNKHINSDFDNETNLLNHIYKVKTNLYDLSEIQLDEGSRQMSITQRAIETVELFTQIEIYILIALAIVIQIIVLYKPNKKVEEK